MNGEIILRGRAISQCDDNLINKEVVSVDNIEELGRG